MKNELQKSLRVFDDRACNVGEGPISTGDRNNEVWWVDILEKKILLRNIEDGSSQETSFNEDVSFLIPCTNGDFIVGTASGPLRLTRNGIQSILPTRKSALGHEDEFAMRWNDAKVAPDGHLWLGTIAYDLSTNPKDCALFRLHKNGKELKKVIDGVGISNGIAWNSDGSTMFFIDTPTLSIDSFDYHDGELSNRRRRWSAPDESFGFPDGMCIDSEDGLWVAFWNGGKVRRFDSNFEISDEIDLSQPFVTSCAFASEKLNLLIITTAHFNKSITEENAGKTYCVDVSIPGKPTQLFPG